jgi:hypothetical protein
MTKMLDTGARYSNLDVWFVKSSHMNSMISSTKEITSQNDEGNLIIGKQRSSGCNDCRPSLPTM